MEKLELLMEKYPNDVMEVIDNLYKEKFPKGKKTIYNFKVLGKNYINDVFTKNYVSFLRDISFIHGYELFERCIHPYYISRTGEELKQVHKVNEGIYVSGYSSTEKKIQHIMSICDLLGLDICEIC